MLTVMEAIEKRRSIRKFKPDRRINQSNAGGGSPGTVSQ